jgi:hypothetical protein
MAAGMIGPFSKLKYPLQINHIYNAEEIMESLYYEDNERVQEVTLFRLIYDCIVF